MVALPSYIVDALPCWCLLCGRVSTPLRHPPRYPFTDIRRAVSEFDSVGLSDDQEFHRVPVDEQNIFEVDGHDATCFEHALKYVQVLGSDPTAYTHDHAIVFSRKSVNSEAHGSSFARRLSIFLTSLRRHSSRACGGSLRSRSAQETGPSDHIRRHAAGAN